MTAAGKSRAYASRVARGLRRLEVWLPAECLDRLDELVESSGYTRPELIETMIDLDHASLVQAQRK